MEAQGYTEVVPLSEAERVLNGKSVDIKRLTINCSPYCSCNQDYSARQMEDMLEVLFEEPKGRIQELEIDMSGCSITREIITPLAHLLRLRANILVSLDLSNTRLSDEMLEILLPTFRDSRMSSLNLAFTDVTEDGVEKLANQVRLMGSITELDLRGLDGISDARAKGIIEHLRESNLATLKCSCPHFIAMIDRLECLVLHHAAPDFSSVCCRWLRHNSVTPGLKCIDFSGNMHSGDTLYYLLRSMKGSFQDLAIRFSGCHVDDRTLMKVASLSSALSVEFLELHLDSNDITDRGLRALLRYLDSCKVKGNVYVRNCLISSQGIRDILETNKDSSVAITAGSGLCFSLSDARHSLPNERPKTVSPTATTVSGVSRGNENRDLQQHMSTVNNNARGKTHSSSTHRTIESRQKEETCQQNKTIKEAINKRCVVLYSWSSSDKRMLSIRAGEEYTVLFLFQDWYYAVGEDGREGYIPPKYVRLVE